MHTAVKIAPRYSNPVVHVLDASRSVVVSSNLLDQNNREDFIDDLDDEYEELREEHYESLKDRRFVSYKTALESKYKIDWENDSKPIAPKFLGEKIIDTVDFDRLLSHIDWNPFFQTWQLRGKYPNRNYPKIFNDETVGSEAKKLYADALKMLDEIRKSEILKFCGIVGFYSANSVGDDIYASCHI